MKSVFKKLLLVAAVLNIGGLVYGQLVYQGEDQYIGAEPSKPYWQGSDVMGTYDVYSLTNWSVSLDQLTDTLTVQIYGSYFDAFMANPAQTATQLGDLFISTDGLAWDTPDQTLTDQYGSTSWEYAVQLGEYLNTNNALAAYDMNNPHMGNLVAITDPGNQIKLSDEFFPPPYDTQAYRKNQEVQVKNVLQPVDTIEQTVAPQLLAPTTWYIDTDQDMLSISIGAFSLMFGEEAFGNLGFHWTMSCGNDVVEFAVPEPSTVGILGALGLMGLLIVRRRLTRK